MQKFYRMWVMLVVIACGCFAFFGGAAAWKVWKFFSFNERGRATVQSLEVVPVLGSRFGVAANYVFEVDGKSYSGKSSFDSLQFVNELAAEHHLRKMRKDSWKVSYKRSDPSVSALDLKFPYKSCLEAALTLGVAIYFYSARKLVNKLCGT